MTFGPFELALLEDAWEQMSEDGVKRRLSAFKKLRKTKLNNEGWFEWELYYRLLNVKLGWKKDKKNRRGNNWQPGDGIDLQFLNNKSIELRAVTTENGNMRWVLRGFKDHERRLPNGNLFQPDAVLFLALRHAKLENVRGYERIDSKIFFEGREFEIKTKDVNEDWIVGIVTRAQG